MKKAIILLAALLALTLCACGEESPAPTTTAPTTAPAVTTEPTAVPTTVPETTTAPTTEATEAGDDRMAMAESCIGKSVEELYDLIGEPESSDYAPGCLGPGEDGELVYEGFTVYTYREDGEETVRVVLAN